MSSDLSTDYIQLVNGIKDRICRSQVKANLSVNRELIILYMEIGSLIAEKQVSAGWGAGVIPRLARDLQNELPGLKGFSERNLNRQLKIRRVGRN